MKRQAAVEEKNGCRKAIHSYVSYAAGVEPRNNVLGANLMDTSFLDIVNGKLNIGSLGFFVGLGWIGYWRVFPLVCGRGCYS